MLSAAFARSPAVLSRQTPCPISSGSGAGGISSRRVPAAHHPRTGSVSCHLRGLSTFDWQMHRERGAGAYLTVYRDPSAMFVRDNGMADGQPLTRTPSHRLGGEEGVEHLFQIFRWNAATIVGDGNLRLVMGGRGRDDY